MSEQSEPNKFLGIVSVTTSKSTERDLFGRTTNEARNLTIEVKAEVPQQFLDAADAISNAGPRIIAGAHAAGTTIKNGVAARLTAPADKKKR